MQPVKNSKALHDALTFCQVSLRVSQCCVALSRNNPCFSHRYCCWPKPTTRDSGKKFSCSFFFPPLFLPCRRAACNRGTVSFCHMCTEWMHGSRVDCPLIATSMHKLAQNYLTLPVCRFGQRLLLISLSLSVQRQAQSLTSVAFATVCFCSSSNRHQPTRFKHATELLFQQ